MDTKVRYFQTNGITFQVNSEFPIDKNTFHPKFNPFETSGPGEDTVILTHHFYMPDLSETFGSMENELYKKDQWHIYKTRNHWIYHYHPIFVEDPQHAATAVFNRAHTCGDIYFDQVDVADYRNLKLLGLTGLPTDQILMARLMVDRNGFLFHANGVCFKGRTILFTGESGAGKTTISRMMQQAGGKVFCDDRAIIQRKNTGFTASGSWIHPVVTRYADHTGNIGAVFFIEQSKENLITPIPKTTRKYENAMKAIVKSFSTAGHWAETLGLVDEFVRKIPFYTLKFKLTNDICSLIEMELESEGI